MIISLNAINLKSGQTFSAKIEWGIGMYCMDMPENKATMVGHISADGKGILVTETTEQIEALVKERQNGV